MSKILQCKHCQWKWTISSSRSTFILSINRILSSWDIWEVLRESVVYFPNYLNFLLLSISKVLISLLAIWKLQLTLLLYCLAFFLDNITIVVLCLLAVLNNLFFTSAQKGYENPNCLMNFVSLMQSFITHYLGLPRSKGKEITNSESVFIQSLKSIHITFPGKGPDSHKR